MFLTLRFVFSKLGIMKKIHAIQQQLLDLLVKNNNEPITVREMQHFLEVSSTSIIAHHLKQLEKKGYLKRNPFNPQDYQILKGAPEKQITYLNLYGLAHCGPQGSLLDGQPIDRIPISTRLLNFPAEDGFLLRAKGESMMPKICDGDLVIGKKAKHPPSGSVVVCINNGETLIKQYHEEHGEQHSKAHRAEHRQEKMKRDHKIILTSTNPRFPPFLAAEDFRIEGEVRGIISIKI